MGRYAADSVKFRTHYSKLLDPKFTRQILLFQGVSGDLPERLPLAEKIVNDFLSAFSDLKSAPDFTKCWDDGVRYMGGHSALALLFCNRVPFD
jgi:hypothetical protein